MTDTQTTPPTTAVTTTPRRTATRPTVSVRPAAVGALNAATIAGATAVAAGGGIVLATAAGAGALAATAVGARRTGNSRTQRSDTASNGRGGRNGGGSSRLGRSGAASPGSRPSPTAGSRSGGAGRSPRLGNLLPAGSRPGKPTTGRSTSPAAVGRSGSRTGGPSTPTGHRRAGSKPGSSIRSPLTADKVAAARRRLAKQRKLDDRQAGPRIGDAVRDALKPDANGKKPTARQAWRAARQNITGKKPVKRDNWDTAVAGVVAGVLAAWKVHRAKKVAQARRDAARAARNARIAARLSNTSSSRVGTSVRQPTNPTTTQTTRKPAPAPAPRRANTNTNNPTADNTRGLITMTHPLLGISDDFLRAAARNQPEGMLQVTAEAHMLRDVMQNFVQAMKIRFERAEEEPLHPQIKEMYGLVHKAQMAVLKAAEEIGPAIEKVHAHELGRLRNQRVGEEMWDVARNRGAI